MQSTAAPLGKAMYVASEDDHLWLQSVQRKLYARSHQQPEYVFEKLWGLVTDLRNLRIALDRVRRNRGARTAGVDGITVRKALLRGEARFLGEIRKELRAGTHRPMPARRVLIPKAGHRGKFRPLGIPTVKDRVIQAAVKNIIEPIFEADFYPVSYGFRPGKSVHGAIAHLKALMLPRGSKHWKRAEKLPFQWALEGDIKGCFDNIDHHALMQRVRRRVVDTKLTRLVVAFLKAGVLSKAQFLRSDSGTPQGGILSPLLANIALGAIEERYERYAWPRGGSATTSRDGRPSESLTDSKLIARRANETRANDKRRGRVVFMPIRYADDFIILASTPLNDASNEARSIVEREKALLATQLEQQLGLSLSAEKTLVTPVTSTMRFLGFHLRVRTHRSRDAQVPRALIPKERTQRLRLKIKGIFRRNTCETTLESRLRLMNRIVRGWAHFFKHAWGAKRVFSSVDHYVWWTIFRWLRKKHPNARTRDIKVRYGWRKSQGKMLRWRDGDTYPFALAAVRVRPFRFAWQKTPDFASTSMESPVRNESRTPGSVRGTRKPARRRSE